MRGFLFSIAVSAVICNASVCLADQFTDKFSLMANDYNSGNFQSAINAADSLLKSLPSADNDRRILLHDVRARAAWRQSGVSALTFRSEDAAKVVSLLGPKARKFYVDFGLGYYQRGRRADSLFSFAQIILFIDRTDFDSYKTISDLYKEEGDLHSAASTWNPYIAAVPGDFRAFYNRGNSLSLAKQYDAAIADFTASIALKADFPSAYINRGNALMKTGNCVAAIQDYSRYIDVPPARYGRGVCNVETGNYKGAFDDLSREVGKSTDQSPAYFLALAKYGLGDLTGAAADLEFILTKAPSLVDARRTLGLIYLAQGKFPQAHETLTQVLAISPKDVRALRGRGIAKLKMGNVEEAVGDFMAAYIINPSTDTESVAMSIIANAHNKATSAGLSGKFPLANNLDEKWPRQILYYYEGSISREAFFNLAATNRDTCRAPYYAGLKDLLTGDKDSGLSLMRKALEGCSLHTFESFAARAELASR